MKEKEKNTKNSSRVKNSNPQTQPLQSLDADIDANFEAGKASNEKIINQPQSKPRPPGDSLTEDVPNYAALTADLRAHEEKYTTRSGHFTLTVVVSVIVGLSSGVVGSLYLAPWLQTSVIGGSLPVATSEIRKVELDENSAIIDVVKEVNAAVVSIIVSKDLPKIEQYYSSPFGGSFPDFYVLPFGYSGNTDPDALQKQTIGAGSGFIATSDGLIITNKHVVADDKAEYTVITSEGKKYAARVLSKDPLNDLAVVKIDVTGLPTVQIGDSSRVQLGQRVVAIGNTLGELSNTVTTGVISGLSRTVSAGDASGATEQLQEVFQTDAAINPGNSGGPLLNLAGQVIGVNTAIDQSGQLVGFAIPSSEAKKVLEDVQKFGRVMRPFMGVRYVIVDPDLAAQNQLPSDHGAMLVAGERRGDAAIVVGGPAEKAGLLENDIILEIDANKIDSTNTLSRILKNYKPGDQIVLKVQRGKDTKQILLTLDEAK